MALSVADWTYHQLREEIEADPATRGRRVSETAAALGVHVQTVYRGLASVGWVSGRKPRKDRGTTCVSMEDLATITEISVKGINKKGHHNVPRKLALQVAKEQGVIQAEVSYGHICKMLRANGMGTAHLRAPEGAVRRISDHPNHVWFFDISVAICWYFKDPETGKRLAIYTSAGEIPYEGKRAPIEKKVILRFAMTDHTTGAYYIRYYYSAGENAQDIVDFFFRAMSPKALGNHFPFRGVPARLVMDQGSGNKSAMVRNLCESLDIKVQYHRVRNAKASGAVEGRHRHWQESFEGLLAQCPAGDLETLNAWAEKTCAILQSERKHTRHGTPPLQAWMRITEEQLVECPDRETFFALAQTNAMTRVLTANYAIQINSQWWEIGGENIFPGQTITARLCPFTEAGIRVTDADGQRLTAMRLTKDAWGFLTGGKWKHKWDDPTQPGAVAPQSAAKRISKSVREDEGTVKLDKIFDNLDERVARYEYITRHGTPHTLTGTGIEEELLNDVEARDVVRNWLGGDARLSKEDGAFFKEHAKDGVTRTQLVTLFEARFGRVLSEAR